MWNICSGTAENSRDLCEFLMVATPNLGGRTLIPAKSRKVISRGVTGFALSPGDHPPNLTSDILMISASRAGDRTTCLGLTQLSCMDFPPRFEDQVWYPRKQRHEDWLHDCVHVVRGIDPSIITIKHHNVICSRPEPSMCCLVYLRLPLLLLFDKQRRYLGIRGLLSAQQCERY